MKRTALLSATVVAATALAAACGSDEEVLPTSSGSSTTSPSTATGQPSFTETASASPTVSLTNSTPTLDVEALRAELDQNRQKWRVSGITDYQYRVALICFCLIGKPVNMEVHGDLVSMTHENGMPVDTTSTGYDLYPRYSTIDREFDEIEMELAKADSVRVTYDSALGYPTRIDVDNILSAVDDELSVEITGFVQLGG